MAIGTNGPMVLSMTAAAYELGVTPKALRKRVERHQIPFKKWGGKVVFMRRELEKFFENLPGGGCDEPKN
jgi:hypothetical protein